MSAQENKAMAQSARPKDIARQFCEQTWGYGSPKDLPDLLSRINYIVGSPSTVAKQLNQYIAQTEVDRLGVKMHLAGLPNEDVRRSMRLFAQEVAPKVQLLRQLEAVPA